MSKNKTQIALIMSSAFFFAFASCSALADPYGCAIHTAGGDKDFRKMSVNSAPERSGDLNGSLKFMWMLEKNIIPVLFF